MLNSLLYVSSKRELLPWYSFRGESWKVSGISLSQFKPFGLMALCILSATLSACAKVSLSQLKNGATSAASSVAKDLPSELTYAPSLSGSYTVNSSKINSTPSLLTGVATAYSIQPTLPAGLSLDSKTGVITGTPIELAEKATYTVTASNDVGSTTLGLTFAVIDSAPTGLIYNPSLSGNYTRGISVIHLTPSSSGGNPVTYTISPELPAGLTLDASTGVISGTPSALATSKTYTITATNTGGNTTADLTFAVIDSPPTGLFYSPNLTGNYTKGVSSIVSSPVASGGALTTYAVSPALPAGLTLNTTTGVISGTPTVLTPSNTYTITGSNTGGSTTVALTFTIVDPAPTSLSYSPNLTGNYTKNVSSISSTASSSGGAVVSYSVSSALPAGLALNTSTGAITGTPTVLAASSTYTVTATNTGGSTTVALTFAVVDPAPSGLSYSPNLTGNYSQNVSNINSTASSSGGAVVSYSVSPALPAGLALDASTGAITGTPTTATASNTYTVTATNMGGSTTAALTFAIVVPPPTSLSYSPNLTGNYTKNVSSISSTASSSGGAVVSYSVSPALPAGLALNTSTGAITGTPTALAASNTYTVTATNSGGSTTASLTFAVVDVPPSSISYPAMPRTYQVGSAISSLTPTVGGGTQNLVYSISPALPSGMSLNTSTGVISGTPTQGVSTKAYSVSVSNTGGSASATLAFRTLDLGDGADGALTVSTTTSVNKYAAITDPLLLAGATTIHVNTGDPAQNDVSSFSAGQEILILQMQGADSSTFSMEYAKIQSINADAITLTAPLANSYASDTFDAIYTASPAAAQIVNVPHYTSVTIGGGATLTPGKAWDGTSGGILIFRATGTVNVGGAIDASEYGYRGGPATVFSYPQPAGMSYGIQGESWSGKGTQQTSTSNGQISPANGGGGAASSFPYSPTEVYCYGSGGGGGGYGSAGVNGSIFMGSCSSSYGGSSYGSPDLATLFLGSGGGNFGSSFWGATVGANGGGVIAIFGSKINLLSSGGGKIDADGGGGVLNYVGASSAGGAGGSIYLNAATLALSHTVVHAKGGTQTAYSGAGGSGRIRIDYDNATGSTSPAPGYQDGLAPATLTYPGGGTVNLIVGEQAEILPFNSGGAPASYSISSNGSSLPSWLSFDTLTGILSGFVTSTNSDPTVFTVTATNSYGSTTQSFQIAANAGSANLGTSTDGANTNANGIINHYAYVTDGVLVGSNDGESTRTIHVDDTTGFGTGDTVLVIQMQGLDYTKFKQEYASVASVPNGTTLNLSSDLKYSYASSKGNTAASEMAAVTQVVRVPQYTNFTVPFGNTVTGKAWDGYSGGIIALQASGTVTINGSVDATGIGYRGAPDTNFGFPDGYYSNALQGESWPGLGGQTYVYSLLATSGSGSRFSYPNGGGGASGGMGRGGGTFCWSIFSDYGYTNSAGGGGYGTTGADFPDDGTYCGASHGGSIYGSANLTHLFLGSGGGETPQRNPYNPTDLPGAGGAGGGVIFISANSIGVGGSGWMSADGITGSESSGLTSRGGGGSGGSIYLQGNALSLGNGQVHANGGVSAQPGFGFSNSGGIGRIRLDAYTSLAGTTSPGPGLVIGPAPSGLSYSPGAFTYKVGQSVSIYSSVTGGGMPNSYSISPSLPTGLSLDAVSGAISGIPTAPAAQATYSVTASNSSGSSTATFDLTLDDCSTTGSSWVSFGDLTYSDPVTNYTGKALRPRSVAVGSDGKVIFAGDGNGTSWAAYGGTSSSNWGLMSGSWSSFTSAGGSALAVAVDKTRIIKSRDYFLITGVNQGFLGLGYGDVKLNPPDAVVSYSSRNTVGNSVAVRSDGSTFVAGSGFNSINHWIVAQNTPYAYYSGNEVTDDYVYDVSNTQGSVATAVGIAPNDNVYVVGYGKDSSGTSHWIVRVPTSGLATDANNKAVGATWNNIDDFSNQTAPFVGAVPVAITFDESNHIYVAGYGIDAGGNFTWIVRQSTDAGATWSVIDTYYYTGTSGAPNSKPTGIQYSGGALYVTGTAVESDGVTQHWITRKGTLSGSWSWSVSDDFVYSGATNTTGTGIAAGPLGDIYTVGYGLNADGVDHALVRKLGCQ